MPYDYSQATIPVYPGINDLVIPPNSTKGGNGGHLVEQINRIATNLNADFNQLSQQVSTVEQSQQQLENNTTTQISTINNGLQTLDAKTSQLESDLNNLTANFDPETGDINVEGIAFLNAQKDIHVATTGDDVSGDGSSANPYATPTRALYDVANQALGQEGSIHIKIAPGYYVEERISYLPNFLDSGQYYTSANAGNQGYDSPNIGALFIEGTGVDENNNPDPSQTQIHCAFDGYHTNGRIVFNNLTMGRDPEVDESTSWRWGIYVEQHSGWIYLRNLRVGNYRDNLIFAGDSQVLADGDIAVEGSLGNQVFYLLNSKFVSRGLEVTLEATASVSGYWNVYNTSIEAWFYGITYTNNTGANTTGDYFALHSTYASYSDLPDFAYNGDAFMTDGCNWLNPFQNYWAFAYDGYAITSRRGDTPPGQAEYDEQEFRIDSAFEGSFRTSGAIAFFIPILKSN